MGIRINKKAKMRSIESRFELSFKRERIDIAKLLKEIKGKSFISTYLFTMGITFAIVNSI